jgi:NADH:quinone reductase (non-electrogenic)
VPEPQKEHRVVIVGAGFAGYNAARELSKLVGDTTEIVVINSADYALNAITPPEATSFGLISSESVPLDVDKPPGLF